MPAVSEAQRKFIFAHFGSAWAHKHHFANKGKLPPRASERQRLLEVARRRRLHR